MIPIRRPYDTSEFCHGRDGHWIDVAQPRTKNGFEVRLARRQRGSLNQGGNTMATDEPKIEHESRGLTRRSVASVLVVAAVILASGAGMGRVWWCEAGDLWPWSWDVWSRHCSQHLVDPYSLSHLQHGIALYLILTALWHRRLSPDVRLLLVALVEAAWEITENTNWMIERYRATTISLDYFGDSILNSLCDYFSCIAGVLLAVRLPWRISVALLVAIEVLSICWIRDSLLLNILMLICPVDAIREWQMASC
jgi:hypothetical protein